MESKTQEKTEPGIESKLQTNDEIKGEVKGETEAPINLMQRPEVDADRLFKLLDSSVQGLRECRLIATAFELGVFETLKVPLSAVALAEKLGCNPLLMPHFCEALHSLGLLDRFEEGAYQEKGSGQEQERGEASENGSEGKVPDISEDNVLNRSEDSVLNSSESKVLNSGTNSGTGNGTKCGGAVYLVSELSATYLLKSSPFSQQHYLAERLRNIELWARLPQIMKKGPEIFEKGPFFEEVIQCMAENARCGMLQETVRVVMENIDFGNIKKMLDLGGGHGLYTIGFAKLNENLQAFVFDLPPVTEKTKQFIEKYGASNVDVIPGDFFKDEIGSEYDLIFSSFNPGGKVPSLLPKIAGALNPGGIFITRQVLDEKMKSSPLFSLDWNLWTFDDVKKGGSGYSFENSIPFSEYIEMLGKYGLEIFQTLDMKEASRIVFARKLA